MGNLFASPTLPAPQQSPPAPAAPKKVYEFTIRGEKVPVTFEKEEEGQHAEKVQQMKAFLEWEKRLDKEFIVKSILIQSVDMFGPRVGFIKFKATVSDSQGSTIPSIVFMRGAAVAMLIIIEGDDGKKYTILTVQPRFPTGKHQFADLPAGMLDDSENFAGVAAKELKEETGIVVNSKDLIDLTDLAFKDQKWYKDPKDAGVYPSCGGCDEVLRYFLYRTKMDTAQLIELHGKCTGVLEENEKIKLKVIPFDQLWNACPDSKALTALCLYQNLEQRNKLPK